MLLPFWRIPQETIKAIIKLRRNLAVCSQNIKERQTISCNGMSNSVLNILGHIIRYTVSRYK